MFAPDDADLFSTAELFELYHGNLHALLARHTANDDAALRALHRKYQELLREAGRRTWAELAGELLQEYLDCLPEGDE